MIIAVVIFWVYILWYISLVIGIQANIKKHHQWNQTRLHPLPGQQSNCPLFPPKHSNESSNCKTEFARAKITPPTKKSMISSGESMAFVARGRYSICNWLNPWGEHSDTQQRTPLPPAGSCLGFFLPLIIDAIAATLASTRSGDEHRYLMQWCSLS